jgi:hypothetical protein
MRRASLKGFRVLHGGSNLAARRGDATSEPGQVLDEAWHCQWLVEGLAEDAPPLRFT